jgi:hypothetical protein
MSKEQSFGSPDKSSFTRFDENGKMIISGNGKVKKIVQIGLGALKAPLLKPASYVNFGINGSYEFVANDENNVSFSIALPRDMDKSIAPSIGFAWSSPTTTGNVRWELMYLYEQPNQDTSTIIPDDTIYQTDAVNSIANGYSYNYMQLNVPNINDRILVVKFSRLGNDELDTANDVVNLLYMSLEYTINKLGD